jgi:hypothetical protein
MPYIVFDSPTNAFGDERLLENVLQVNLIGLVRRGVFKGVEDGRRAPTLRPGLSY